MEQNNLETYMKGIRIGLLLSIPIWILIIWLLFGCTENQKARQYGGTETITLPKGQRLLTVTWKGGKEASDLWYLTEPMPQDYQPATKTFHEKSTYGIWNGTVIFIESK